jgi:CRP/FNR family transcriptional regulator
MTEHATAPVRTERTVKVSAFTGPARVPTCNLLRSCSFADSCSGAAADGAPLIVDHRRLRRGRQLFRSGERFLSLFLVQRGFFKTVVMTEDGREQVTGFHMAGDMIGLDGIATRIHTSTAIALEDSEVCVFPFDRIGVMAREVPELHDRLHAIMSSEIVREHHTMLMLGSMHSDERVAAFLQDLMARLHARGWSGSETVLRMTRHDIGNYLGLTLETVSRAFSVLAAEGVIRVHLRHIKILRPDCLRRLADCRAGLVPALKGAAPCTPHLVAQ